MKRLLLSLVLVIAVAFSADAAIYILTWTDTATGESAWQVQRKVEGGAYSQLGSDLVANSTTTTDSTAADGTSYRYRVRAIVGGAGQPFSNEVCMPVACAPAAPTNVHVTGQAAPAQIGLSASIYTDSGTDATQISFVRSAPFVTGARIAWQTSSDTASRVDYGATTAYGLFVIGAAGVGATYTQQATGYFHVVTISGLVANTVYHYKVTSGSFVSADRTFTTYANPTGTVKTVGASGKDYTTVAACATAAQPGWTCLVYAGTYASATPASGSAGGGYVTLLAQEAASIAGVNVAAKTYVAVKGFESTSALTAGQTGSNTSYITFENNYVHNCGQCIRNSEYNTHSWWIVRNNIIRSGNLGIMISGINTLIDGNAISDVYVDCMYDGALQYSVVRNNACHDYGPQTPGDTNQHVDMFQWDGNSGSSPIPFEYNLFEGNTSQRCMDSTGNCHFFIDRDDPYTGPRNIIFRYSYAQETGGGGIMFGMVSPDVIYSNRAYNNTLAFLARGGEANNDGWVTSTWRANYTKILNNFSYNSPAPTSSPFDCDGTGVVCNYNVARDDPTPTATWGTNYQNEATYSTLKNLAPSFANYPNSYALSPSSALIDKGGNLTTVTSGCGTSTLTLADVRWFQPGWAGTQADTLAIGATVTASTKVQLTGINYSGTASVSSGTVTFGGAVACTNGDKVWLYAKSDGVRVLYGTAPDIGAYEVVK
jgi:hypothetical protein